MRKNESYGWQCKQGYIRIFSSVLWCFRQVVKTFHICHDFNPPPRMERPPNCCPHCRILLFILMFQWRLRGLSVVIQCPLLQLLISPRISLNPQLYEACFCPLFLYNLSSVISQLFVTGVVKHCSDSCFRPPLFRALPCWRWILNMLNSCGDRSSGSESPTWRTTSLFLTKSITLASH